MSFRAALSNRILQIFRKCFFKMNIAFFPSPKRLQKQVILLFSLSDSVSGSTTVQR
jgi:hypothetical protein